MHQRLYQHFHIPCNVLSRRLICYQDTFLAAIKPFTITPGGTRLNLIPTRPSIVTFPPPILKIACNHRPTGTIHNSNKINKINGMATNSPITPPSYVISNLRFAINVI